MYFPRGPAKAWAVTMDKRIIMGNKFPNLDFGKNIFFFFNFIPIFSNFWTTVRRSSRRYWIIKTTYYLLSYITR